MTDIEKNNLESMKKANNAAIYKTITIGVIISIIGVYARFAADNTMLSILSWLVLFVGAYICCKAVFKILNA